MLESLMKIKLRSERISKWLEPVTTRLTESLPYYMSNHAYGPPNGRTVHLVKSGQVHWRDAKRDFCTHVSVTFWCGGSGSTLRGQLMHNSGNDAPCKRCVAARIKSRHPTDLPF
jgi:hypothetical protein